MKDTIEEITFESVVASAWDGAETNAEAAENLLSMMRSDPNVYRQIMEPHEKTAASQAVNGYKQRQRHRLWTRPSAPDARVDALARGNAGSLFEMRLPSGKRLGDALRDEVEDAAQTYHDLAEWNAAKARFFKAIAEKMPPRAKKRVADVLTAAELEELKNAK